MSPEYQAEALAHFTIEAARWSRANRGVCQ
jgi:hypothetical protein